MKLKKKAIAHARIPGHRRLLFSGEIFEPNIVFLTATLVYIPGVVE